MANAERLRKVARIITDTYKAGNQVVAVLSAQGDTTDDLIEKAKEINPNCSNREMDMLLSTGEQISVSLCAMAIEALFFSNRFGILGQTPGAERLLSLHRPESIGTGALQPIIDRKMEINREDQKK